jgi:hypothetical protein
VLGSISPSCLSREQAARSAREGLEDGFDLVVIGAAVHGLHVDVGAGAAGEALEEIGDEFGLQIADQAHTHLGVDAECRPPAQIHRGDGEGLVHGHEEVAGAQDAALSAEGAVKRLAQGDADVFDGVVLIDVQIAVALEVEIEGAVAREELEHVIEEANAGGNFIAALALDGEFEIDACLRGVPRDDCSASLCIGAFAGHRSETRGAPPFGHIGAHLRAFRGHCAPSPSRSVASVRCRAAAASRICSRVPMVMRTRPSHPGSEERSRTSTPWLRIRRTNSA